MRVSILLLGLVGVTGLLACGGDPPPTNKSTEFEAGVSFINGVVSEGDGTRIEGECSQAGIGMGSCEGQFLLYCDISGSSFGRPVGGEPVSRSSFIR